jgi:hypothetical protein
MTIGGLIDRIFNEWLTRIGDRPPQVELAADIGIGDSQVILTPDQLTYEEQALLISNAICEIGSELIRVTDFDPATNVALIKRNQLGSTAAVHVAGDLLFVEPEYTRHGVLQALGDEIVGLYPELWRMQTMPVSSAAFVELPLGAAGVISVVTSDGEDLGGVFRRGFDRTDTGLAVLFDDWAWGRSAWLTYSSGFTRPTSEADTLESLGLEDRWQRLLMISVLSVVLRGKEFDQASIEFLTEAIEAQALQLGSLTNVATALMRLRAELVRKEHQALVDSTGIRVVTARVI